MYVWQAAFTILRLLLYVDKIVFITNSPVKANKSVTNCSSFVFPCVPLCHLYPRLVDIPSEYHVLDTDYTSFSSVYNCVQIGPERVSHWMFYYEYVNSNSRWEASMLR